MLRPFLLILIWAFPTLGWGQDYVPGEVIVKMKEQPDGSAALSKVALRKMARDQDLSLKQSFHQLNMHQFEVEGDSDVQQTAAELSMNPMVEFAEPNYIYGKQSLGIEGEALSFSEVMNEVVEEDPSSDESLGSLRSFHQTSVGINVSEAWQLLSSGRERPIVAVIDSGVDYNHYVFAESGAIWSNEDEIPDNGIDDDRNGYVDDVRGWNFVSDNNDPMDDDNHGTHVSGIVLGVTQNILSYNIQPAIIQIMPLKTLDHNGMGTTSAALEAINYALANGAHVLNNSWGGHSYSRVLHEAVTQAYQQGKAFVAASGNEASDNDSLPMYPASYAVPNVVSVAATNSRDDLASFSNYGVNTVHVGSPGQSIRSTLPNNSFGYSSGTSMATPFASGLAALMIREKAHINGYQVKGVLYQHSQRVNGLAGKVASQSRIDAFEALQFVQDNNINLYQPNYSLPDRTLASAGGGCGLLAKVLKDKNNRGKGQGSSGGRSPMSGTTLILLAFLFSPVVLMNALRIRRRKLVENRAFTRYKMDSEVKIQVGDKQVIGSMSSISMGGARIDTDALLEKGGIVSLSISSPEGEQQVQAQGRVVWMEEKKSYGVQFFEAPSQALSTISGWTTALATED